MDLFKKVETVTQGMIRRCEEERDSDVLVERMSHTLSTEMCISDSLKGVSQDDAICIIRLILESDLSTMRSFSPHVNWSFVAYMAAVNGNILVLQELKERSLSEHQEAAQPLPERELSIDWEEVMSCFCRSPVIISPALLSSTVDWFITSGLFGDTENDKCNEILSRSLRHYVPEESINIKNTAYLLFKKFTNHQPSSEPLAPAL